MKILVVGGGGREHAIIKKLKESPAVTEIFALPGNGGISADATCVPIGATDLDGIVQFVKEHPVDYAVVTPDDPLVLGCVDRLNEIGVPCFGPKQNAAVIEGSKAFAKDLMKKYHIPTARYETFSDLQAALDYVQAQPLPLVVKADGLALGKGVLIPQNLSEAEDAVKNGRDITSHTFNVDELSHRVMVADIDTGEEIQSRIDDLMKLLEAFRDGIIKVDQAKAKQR